MITVKVEGLEATIKRLAEINKKILPNVIAKSLTKTAMKVRANVKGAMTHHFDRPTPYTMNSLYLQGATDTVWEARVWFKDKSAIGKGNATADYIYPQVHGGGRKRKRFETVLSEKGHLPDGWYAVPGSGAKLNKYGNISAGQIVQIITALGVLPGRPTIRGVEVPFKTKSKAVKTYFAIKPGTKSHLAPGVYQRLTSSIKCVLIFTNKRPTYKPLLPFYEIARKTKDLYLERTIKEEFAKRMNR